MADSIKLTRNEIEWAFSEMGERALAIGKVVEIAVYGGAAIMLAYAERQQTRDVDAVFEQNKATIRKISTEIAAECGWPEDWLNDGVKGFLSHRDTEPGSKALLRSYPSEEEAGLKVFVASPQYLFAMKCMAMRIEGPLNESPDVEDIRKLAEVADIADAESALDVVSSFYPSGMISPKTQFGIEEIFANHGLEPKKP